MVCVCGIFVYVFPVCVLVVVVVVVFLVGGGKGCVFGCVRCQCRYNGRVLDVVCVRIGGAVLL